MFVAALRSEGGAAREVLRRCLQGRYRPLLGNALWLEYEDVLGRKILDSMANEDEKQVLLAALASTGRWVQVYYGWRPNLRDEGDNHLIELAVAGSATAIVTHNVRDLRSGELIWPALRVLTPAQCLKELS